LIGPRGPRINNEILEELRREMEALRREVQQLREEQQRQE
jgi:hypothetical protein